MKAQLQYDGNSYQTHSSSRKNTVQDVVTRLHKAMNGASEAAMDGRSERHLQTCLVRMHAPNVQSAIWKESAGIYPLTGSHSNVTRPNNLSTIWHDGHFDGWPNGGILCRQNFDISLVADTCHKSTSDFLLWWDKCRRHNGAIFMGFGKVCIARLWIETGTLAP